jgi:hypothetical protein
VEDAPALRIDRRHQFLWRLRVNAPGAHRIEVELDGRRYARDLAAGSHSVRALPVIYRAHDYRTLAAPGAAPLEARGPVVALAIDYPDARRRFAGLSSASWLLAGISLLLGYGLRGLLGVTF